MLPGVGPDDLSIEVDDDILNIRAERNKKKYQKEVLLPAASKPCQIAVGEFLIQSRGIP